MGKTTIANAHAEIAKQIRLAKKRMFKAHREGLPLHVARDAFLAEIEEVFAQQVNQLHTAEVQDIGRGLGVSRERHDLADAVAELISNDATPPRLRDAVVDHIADAPPPVIPEPTTEEAKTSARPRESGGYRILTPAEFRFVCEQIAENLTGQAALGLLILLFEHFIGFNHRGEFPLEGEILDALNGIIGSAPDALDRVRKEISSEIGAFMTQQLNDAESEAQ